MSKPMSLDPISGPMPREKLKEAAGMPFGEAKSLIRQYDPQWGRAPGEKFEWKVKVLRTGADEGTAYVTAADEKEAEALADALTESDIDWDYDSDTFEIESVEPCKPKPKVARS